MGIHRTYPYPAYGGLAPVPGGQGEQRDDIANLDPLREDRGGERVNPSSHAILSHVPGLIICAQELSGACLRSGRT